MASIHRKSHNTWVIWLTIIIALLLQIIPWSEKYNYLRPDILLLVLIYWAIILPERISIVVAFILGLILDLFIGNTLGVRALAFSITIYLSSFRQQIISSFAVWQQIVFIIFLTVFYTLFVFLIEYILNSAVTFEMRYLFVSLIDGGVYLLVYVILQWLKKKFTIY